MKVILSPAKKMNCNTDDMACLGVPAFLKETEEVLSYLRGLSFEELKDLWKCNEQIAEQNAERLKYMDLKKNLTPAILSYEGIAYQYMAPSVFEAEEFAYVQEHVRILSAFYGVVKPMEGVTPYRLEMQAKAKVAGTKNLYEFWRDRLYREVRDESGVIINLASKEYSKCIEKYLTREDTYITCVFGELAAGKVVQKGVYAKMARGEMIRYMAVKRVQDPEELKGFDGLGYRFREELSDERTFVFIRENDGNEGS